MSEPIPTPRCDNEVDHASNIALYINCRKHGYTEEKNAAVVPYPFAQTLERETIRIMTLLRISGVHLSNARDTANARASNDDYCASDRAEWRKVAAELTAHLDLIAAAESQPAK